MWKDYLSKEYRMMLLEDIHNNISKELTEGYKICPPVEQIYRAFKLTGPEKVKAVIVGQDPYFNNGQANGLCFSVNPGVALPPSLKNIFKEYEVDTGFPAPKNGDLTKWAKEGVLLLNSILTVRDGKAMSHENFGWQVFTKEIIRICAEDLPQPIVFILWGSKARKITEGIHLGNNKKIITSAHPSPLGCRYESSNVKAFDKIIDSPSFLGSKPFTRTNELVNYSDFLLRLEVGASYFIGRCASS